MSCILIFGGITEGRLLAQALSQRGVPAAVSVATVLGSEELSGLPGITPLVGRKTAQEMATLLSGYDKCVDATHPYAREVSANIRSACRSAGVPLRRLLRRSSELPPGSILAGSPEEAAQLLQSREGNVLLAIGAKGVSAFSGLDHTGRVLAASYGWTEENGQLAYYDEDGYLTTDSWRKNGDDWYYLDEEDSIARN